jgi:hypothetical protein
MLSLLTADHTVIWKRSLLTNGNSINSQLLLVACLNFVNKILPQLLKEGPVDKLVKLALVHPTSGSILGRTSPKKLEVFEGISAQPSAFGLVLKI